MSKLAGGWEVVCPDGTVRHFPYHNYGDADCDADCFSNRLVVCVGCPGGVHTVRPVVFDDTPSERGRA